MTQSKVSLSKSSFMFLTSPRLSINRNRLTGKGGIITFIFIFCLHVIDNNFREIDIDDIFIAFFVHVLAEEGVSGTDIKYFAVRLNELRDDVTKVGPFLIPVELVEVSEVRRVFTKRNVFPRMFACRSDYFSQNT